MGIKLENRKGRVLQVSNTVWCYLINLGEVYGWIPQGTRQPKDYGTRNDWSGNYDSSEGQVLVGGDFKNLINALKESLNDDVIFPAETDKLMKSVQKSIEDSLGRELGYSNQKEIRINFVNNIVAFLEEGEFFYTVN